MKLRTNPATVRLALARIEREGVYATEAAMGIDRRSLYRWIRAREELGEEWPTLDMDREWLATVESRRLRADRLASYRKRRYLNGDRPLLIDATGTRRRVQALMRLGWPADTLATRSGVWATGDALLEITKRDKVTPVNAARVRALYAALCMTPGPSVTSARRAAARGWPPPLAWDDIDTDPAPRTDTDDTDLVDDIVVARVLAGERLTCTPAEKLEVLRRAPAAGRSMNSLEDQMGWNTTRLLRRSAAA